MTERTSGDDEEITAESEPAEESEDNGKRFTVPESVTLTRRGITYLAAAMAVLVVLSATFITLWAAQKNRDDVRLAQEKNDAAAEKVAGDYAVRVATFDYRNMTAWRNGIGEGVSDQVRTAMQASAKIIEPLVTSLRWSAKARLLRADTIKHNGPTYTVQVFLGIDNDTVQGQQSLITQYTIDLNKDAEWQITAAANGDDAQGALFDAPGSTVKPGGTSPTPAAPGPPPPR